MKLRILSLLLALLVFCFAFPALAVEELDPEESQETVTLETEADDKNIVVNVTVQAPAPAAATPDPAPVPVEEAEDAPEESPAVYAAYSSSYINEATTPGTPLSEAIAELFGEYTPRTQTVTEYLSDGATTTHEEVIPGLAGLDWQWLAGVTIFTVFLYCVLRIIGGLFS